MTSHAGYVALVGRPNVGKSTLLNRLLGQKLAITSHKPQTTRHSIVGISTLEGGQIVYIDTPGIHKRGNKAMSRYLNRTATSALTGVDLVVFIVDAGYWTEEDTLVLERVRESGRPTLLVVNKIDTIKPREKLLPLLAKLGEQQPQHITRQESLTRLIQQVAHHQPIHIAENDNDGILLTVTGTHSVLSTLNQQVQIHRKEKPIYRQPWKSLQAIILFGNHQITTQAMHAALRANVPVHLASSNGRYQGVISHNRNSQHQRLWLQQAAILGDQQKALYLAKEIVASRLRFIKEHLRQRKQNAKIPQIETALKKIHHVTKLEQLRGYEGNATREYYQRLSASLPPEFRFDKRTRRPPKDPFNVLLSLGYTSLYALTESHIFAAGLLPWQGFYHQPRGRHAVLASDLMEPFRYLVERTAASLVNNHEIKAEDFSTSATGACHIQNQARRKYLALLIQRFENKIKARGETEAISWLQHLKQQNQSLKRFIQHGEAFKPFRTR